MIITEGSGQGTQERPNRVLPDVTIADVENRKLGNEGEGRALAGPGRLIGLEVVTRKCIDMNTIEGVP